MDDRHVAPPGRARADGARIGLHADTDRLTAVLLDRSGHIRGSAHSGRTGHLGRDIGTILAQLRNTASTFAFSTVSAVTLTAQDSTDSMVSAGRLGRVASLRIGAPLTSAIPPLATWAPQLRDAVDAGSALVAGGVEFSGARVAPLDEKAVIEFAETVARSADAIAITSVFSPVDPGDEITAARLIASVSGTVPITLSHQISTLGLVERENATILNAALRQSAARPSHQLRAAVAHSDLSGAECYFTQNDGTQRLAEYAERFPVFQIGSGIADCVRGAAHLCGLRDADVAQVNDTSITLAHLVNGYPRESLQRHLVQGVLTKFRTPETLTLPIHEPDAISASLLRVSQRTDHLPLVAIGSHAAVIPDDIDGVDTVIRPPYADLANAVGAAVAPVGGSAERICKGQPGSVKRDVEALTSDARARAILAGAAPDALQVIDVEEVPLAYLREPAVHVRVRVAGMPMN
ncbi:hydantoinase/oxoprolinase N-terminal domain-containing protein [Gordonia sp. C13]|uniref:hydantoinase/oxoprolinase N-terminal domain-containing protein n=1 Tax=Gordonia sp. C13 TaxID=2935078 RepID=UPI00200AC906|nr:hydantoinase/oxoprolinase N-terminal domain-containing protein [Gordonia sp. C13]MCK8615320.1 hypothetical protein [Gordonia sp. C13]